MTEQAMLAKLKELVDEKRYQHSIGVRDTAAMLSLEFYGEAVMLGARFDRSAGKAEITLDGESLKIRGKGMESNFAYSYAN